MSLYDYDIMIYNQICLCAAFYDLSAWVWLLVRGLYKEVYLLILNVCPFDYTAFAVSRKVGIS